MSIHRSLTVGSALARSRNVLTRYERILELRKSERWSDDSTALGLPKVRVQKARKRGKDKKKKDDD